MPCWHSNCSEGNTNASVLVVISFWTFLKIISFPKKEIYDLFGLHLCFWNLFGPLVTYRKFKTLFEKIRDTIELKNKGDEMVRFTKHKPLFLFVRWINWMWSKVQTVFPEIPDQIKFIKQRILKFMFMKSSLNLEHSGCVMTVLM